MVGESEGTGSVNSYYWNREDDSTHACDMLDPRTVRVDNDAWRVAKDMVGLFLVSTVFLGIDHNFYGDGPPLLFETMVFHDNLVDLFCDRYSTAAAARIGHASVVEQLRAGKTPNQIVRAA